MMKINLIFTITTVLIVCGFTNGNEPHSQKTGTDKVVELSPLPATSFIKVNIDKMQLPVDEAGNPFNVAIVNSSNIMVFSAKKSEPQFSIYIGGLPNGTYKLLIKMKASDIETSFEVKH